MRGRDIVFGSLLTIVIFVAGVFILSRGGESNRELSTTSGHGNHMQAGADMNEGACTLVEKAEEQKGVYALLGDEYMVCLQNGWSLNKASKDATYYTANLEDLEYKSSTESQIKTNEDLDGPFTLTISISPPEPSMATELIHYKQVAAPEAEEQGTTIWAYARSIKVNDPAGAGVEFLPEGTMQYLFVIESDDSNAVMYVKYSHEPGKPDYSQAVEALVASAHAHTH